MLARENFFKSLGTSLQKVVNTYEARQNRQALNSAHVQLLLKSIPKLSISYGVVGEPKLAKGASLQSKKKFADTVKKWIQQRSEEQMRNYSEAAKSGLAKAFRQVFESPPDVSELSRLYRNELLKSDIRLPVKLSLAANSVNSVNSVHASMGLNLGEYRVVKAAFTISPYFFVKMIIVPVTVSILLIILTLVCLWYLWNIIKQQLMLDTMKNDFVNNMTHELRTPIAILKSTHESLNQFGNITDTETAMRYIDINQSILKKMDNDIDRILDITRYESKENLLKPEEFDLKDLVLGIIRQFEEHHAAAIQLVCDSANPIIFSDRYSIETIVSNLIDNALKYTEDKQEVVVSIDYNKHEWQLQVRDSGLGIAGRFIPYIFDKFYRVPTGNLHNVKGYGLGLSYVKELTGILNGTIKVDSHPGVGSTFTLQFPHKWKP